MANRSSSKPRPAAGNSACSPPAGVPTFTEPEVRRWPHPVDSTPPSACSPACGQTEALLSEIHCDLSRQVQLLTEIRSLLETLIGEPSQESREK